MQQSSSNPGELFWTNVVRSYTPHFRMSLPAICALLLSTEVFPPLLVYLHVAHSLSVGTTFAAILAISFLALSTTVRGLRTPHSSLFDVRANDLLLMALVVGLVFVHGVTAGSIVAVNYHRLSLSLVLLCILFVGSAAIGSALRAATPGDLNRASWICFCFFIGIIIVRLLNLEPDAQAFPKALFPFTETSHFALAFGPIYLYRCVAAPVRRRLVWILLGFALALLLRSATFIALAVVAAILCRRLIIVLIGAATGAFAGAASHLSYFVARADLSAHSSNLSALVYLQGWQFIIRSLEISHGWGLGFQQLGVHPFHLNVTRLIQQLTGGTPLNAMGGSFIFSKLASEFGLFGILLGIAYFYYALESVNAIRRRDSYQHDTLPRCVVVAFGIDMFLRGTGYFYGAPLLFLAAVNFLRRQRQSMRLHYHSRHRNIVALR